MHTYTYATRVTGMECDQLVKKDHVFDYYIRHNDSENALRFIMSRVPPLGNPTPCPTHIQALCTHTPQSVDHLRSTILDELARYIYMYVYVTCGTEVHVCTHILACQKYCSIHVCWDNVRCMVYSFNSRFKYI